LLVTEKKVVEHFKVSVPGFGTLRRKESWVKEKYSLKTYHGIKGV
jgi:hypothetical protein